MSQRAGWLGRTGLAEQSSSSSTWGGRAGPAAWGLISSTKVLLWKASTRILPRPMVMDRETGFRGVRMRLPLQPRGDRSVHVVSTDGTRGCSQPAEEEEGAAGAAKQGTISERRQVAMP